MCGRFSLFTSDDQLIELFGIDVLEGEHRPSFNQAPSQAVRVVIGDQPRALTMQKWGLLPSWSKPGFKPLINAKSETITEKPSFRAASLRRRCLIPANGYYEWALGGGSKQPYFLSMPDRRVLAMAGLSEVIFGPGGEEIHTCAVITRQATEELEHIHPRMPLFVPPSGWDEWLDPTMQDRVQVQEMIQAIPPAPLSAKAVSAAVGNVGTTDPKIIFG